MKATLKTNESLVAFIDILGFSDRVKGVRVTTELEHLISDIETIQQLFQHRPKDKETKDLHSWYKKEVLAFSDCVVVSLPFTSEAVESKGAFDALLSELEDIAYVQGTCVVEHNLFLRGAVDKGLWYRDQDTMVSPALARAYTLEADANMPVITLSEEVHSYFGNHPHRNFYNGEIDPFRKLFRKYSETKSGKTSYFIDYLAICAGSVNWLTDAQQYKDYKTADPDERQEIMDEGYQTNIRRWFTYHKEVIESAYHKANKKIVKEKYEWLMTYHNEVAFAYGLDKAYEASTEEDQWTQQ